MISRSPHPLLLPRLILTHDLPGNPLNLHRTITVKELLYLGGQSILNGHIARIFPIVIHDVFVGIFLEQEFDRFNILLLDTVHETRVTVRVHIVEVSALFDKFSSLSVILSKHGVHKNRQAIDVLLIKVVYLVLGQISDGDCVVLLGGIHKRS